MKRDSSATELSGEPLLNHPNFRTITLQHYAVSLHKKAVYTLKQSLAPLGIEVNLEKKVLDPEPFARDALESNRIWISERPLEEWLGAEVGHSFCCEVCGNADLLPERQIT